ncbi:DUF4097 family beta strand repeat-containing protein [Companilactobacillus baiquanensis]|uniref:DUF4097 family beta strand repeat-containing protein n=1 Tax=Companilactobacillus baiquanensis TaxID=2486005 RepID=A0ABW1USM5_9LACO|nr:DUF4097 family beta strand repeat-containing protein [Companilactobacillus baiquanensis]
MRKYFVTGFYLLVLGAILCVGGYLTGGMKMVAWDHGFKISQKIDETESVKSFSKVKVNGKNVSVRIEKGNKYSVRILGDKLQLPTYEVNKDTLIITGHKRKAAVDWDGRGERVIVTVPKKESLKRMHVNLSEGNVRLRNLTIKKFTKSNKYWNSDASIYLDNVTITEQQGSKFLFDDGYIRIKDSTINNLNFEANDDSVIDIKNSTLNNYKFEMSESNLKIANSKLNGGSINMDDGHIHLQVVTIKGTNDYILTDESTFRSESGNMDGVDFSANNINYFGEKKDNNYQSNPNSENLLKVNATDGSIRVR